MTQVTILREQFDKEVWKKILWVTKAAAKKSTTSPLFECLHVTDDYIECSDSQRLHRFMVQISGIEETGCWKIVKKNAQLIVLKKTDLTFPDLSAIVAGAEKSQILLTAPMSNDTICKIIKKMSGYVGVNIDYLQDMIKDEEFIIKQRGLSCLNLFNETVMAFIMPMRLKD